MLRFKVSLRARAVVFKSIEASFKGQLVFNSLIIEIREATPPRASFRLLISEELRHVIFKLGQKSTLNTLNCPKTRVALRKFIENRPKALFSGQQASF